MKDLQGLSLKDFEAHGTIILGKAEVDRTGVGTFSELEDVTSFSINSSLVNLFQKTYSYSFSIELLNTHDKYSFFDTGKSKYEHIKQGRRVRLYLGIRKQEGEPQEPEIPEPEPEISLSIPADEESLSLYVLGSDYETAWDTYSAFDRNTPELIIGQGYDGISLVYINRGFLFFDTSDIPEEAIITEAKIKFKNHEVDVDNEFDLVVQTGYPYPSYPVHLDDFAETHYSGNYGSVSSTDLQQSTAYLTITDTDETIYKGGLTKLCLRNSNEINKSLTISGETWESIFVHRNDISLEIKYKLNGNGNNGNGDNGDNEVYGDFYWSWFYGVIDRASTVFSANYETCSISGRDYISYLQENYLKNLWWGNQTKLSTEAFREKYDMPSNCKGIYRAWCDMSGDYKEMTLNSEFTYDWEKNQFVFLHPNVPYEDGNLILYYFTPQTIENVVADLLVEAGLLSYTEKPVWLADSKYVTPTGKKIDRVWFQSGTSYLQAINLLAERAIYRFYINSDGIPCFRKYPVTIEGNAKRFRINEFTMRNIEERIDELYNHFLIEGEEREMKKINLEVIAHRTEEITTTSAKLIGSVLADGETSSKHWKLFGGSSIITSKGFKWIYMDGENEIENDYISYNSDMGMFEHEITVEPDTRYSWCVWAKNSLGHYIESNWETFMTEA